MFGKSRALIACMHGTGVVLQWKGEQIESEIRGNDVYAEPLPGERGVQFLDLMNLGLEAAPDGLSVWEGEYEIDAEDDDAVVSGETSSPHGEFRKLTAEEWTKLQIGTPLFEDTP